MQIIIKPGVEQWEELLKRPEADAVQLDKTVRKILQQVKLKGDTAVRKYSRLYDGVSLRKFEVSKKDILAAADSLPEAL